MSYTKDPDANLDYRVDWSAWLDVGETISSNSWIVPSGITKGATTQTATSVTVWLSGGTSGTIYPITSRITTSLGRTNDYTITVIVSDL